MIVPKFSEWLAKFKYKVSSATIVKSDAYVTIMVNMAQVTSGVFFNVVTVNGTHLSLACMDSNANVGRNLWLPFALC